MSTETSPKNRNLTDAEKFELILDSRAIYKRLEDIEAAVKRIELALIGNEKLGQTGLVERITDLEEEVDKMKQRILKWASLVTGVVLAIEFTFKFLIGK